MFFEPGVLVTRGNVYKELNSVFYVHDTLELNSDLVIGVTVETLITEVSMCSVCACMCMCVYACIYHKLRSISTHVVQVFHL